MITLSETIHMNQVETLQITINYGKEKYMLNIIIKSNYRFLFKQFKHKSFLETKTVQIALSFNLP